VLASRDASQLACSFQDAYNGSDGGIVDDDADDDTANTAETIWDDEDPVVQASGELHDVATRSFLLADLFCYLTGPCLEAINAAKAWVSCMPFSASCPG